MGAKLMTFGLVIVIETILGVLNKMTGEEIYTTIGSGIGAIGVLLIVLGIIGWFASILSIFTPTKKVGTYTVKQDYQTIGSGDIVDWKTEEEISDDWSFSTKCFIWGFLFISGYFIGMFLGANLGALF